MQTPESQKVVARFFEALDILKTSGKIRGKKTFCDEMEVNRRNLYQLSKDYSRDIFQCAWLEYLVNKHGISAEWLITGKGAMFKKKALQ